MRDHVKALAILNIIHAILLFSFGLLALLVFGGLAALLARSHVPDSMVIPLLGWMGGAVAAILTVISLPKLIAGIGLLYWQQWARVLLLVISVLGLFEFPVGTGLGLYGLWVLTARETSALFCGRGNHVIEGVAERPEAS
jgi:hypothetical protein